MQEMGLLSLQISGKSLNTKLSSSNTWSLEFPSHLISSSLSKEVWTLQSLQGSSFTNQMGFGRKVDPEPGRCRRTDGKKWRCSKDAFPDSKYCERHMHRGRNRSRKPVEVLNSNPSTPVLSMTRNPTSTTTTTNPSYLLSSLSSPVAAETHNHHHPHYNTPLHPCLYPQSPYSRFPGFVSSPQNNTTHLLLDSGSCSRADKDYRYFHELKGEVDERSFFCKDSGTVRTVTDSSSENPWRFTQLKMSSSLPQSKQRSCSALQSEYSQLQLQNLTEFSKQQELQQQEQHCFVLGTDFKSERPVKVEREEGSQLPLRRFFDEWPPKNRDSWLDLEEERSKRESFSTTQLSISIPMPSPDFSNGTRNDG